MNIRVTDSRNSCLGANFLKCHNYQ